MASLDLGFHDCIAWPMQKLERIWTVQALSFFSFFSCMQASSSSNKIQRFRLVLCSPEFISQNHPVIEQCFLSQQISNMQLAEHSLRGAQYFHVTPMQSRSCLVPRKFCKIFQIPRHIESLDACMKY
jgi:hypothetical protein